MSDNCSAPDRICRSAVFFQQIRGLGRDRGKTPKEEKLGTIGGPRSSLAVAVSWSGYFSEVDFIPFAIRQVDPSGSASRSPSSRRCHLEDALREVSKPRRQWIIMDVSSGRGMDLAPVPWQSCASHFRPYRVFAAILQSADVADLRPPHTRSCLTPGEAKA